MKKNASMIRKYVFTVNNIIRNRIECLKLWARYRMCNRISNKYESAWKLEDTKGREKDFELWKSLYNKDFAYTKKSWAYSDEFFKRYHELEDIVNDGQLWSIAHKINLWNMI